LLGDDQILDLVISGLRDDFLVDEIVLAGVGPTRDDLRRVCRADARQRCQLIRRGRVDVDKSGFRSFRRGLRGVLGLCDGSYSQRRSQEGERRGIFRNVF
jgi:hypothetical protein